MSQVSQISRLYRIIFVFKQPEPPRKSEKIPIEDYVLALDTIPTQNRNDVNLFLIKARHLFACLLGSYPWRRGTIYPLFGAFILLLCGTWQILSEVGNNVLHATKKRAKSD